MSTVEEPRPLSPTPDHAEKNSNETSECRKSPTTVIEAESVTFTQTFPTSSESVDLDEAIEEPVVATNDRQAEEPPPPPPPPPLSRQDVFHKERLAKLRRKQLERRKYLNILPTIQEVSEEEEQGGEVKSLGLALLSEADDILMHIQTLSAPVNSVNDLTEVQHQIDSASQRASRGNEEKALSIYKSVLAILEKEVDRTAEHIKILAMKQSNFESSKVHILLHEEWAENALVVADIKARMALIYERQENYDGAQWCVEEARSIYRRQATFEQHHNKNGLSARDKELLMEDMLDQIEEAMESHSIRQSLHQTVERIREKILATEDETSRGFLYEDIFDKLSTVLSLELMYLGENHPQIANTKGLLGKFYGEVKQNEKAIRIMNEAVLICETALGDSHPQTGSKYQDAAKLHDSIGGEENVAETIELYERAITSFERAEGNVSEELCSSLNRVAILYIQQQNYDVAIEKLKKAIHISEENYRERSDDMSTEPIQLWLNLGECHALQGKPSLASEASKNALRIQKDKRKVFDLLPRKSARNIPELISDSKIALTLKKLGKSLAEESKYKESSGYFMEALAISREEYKTAQERGKFNPNIDLRGHEDEVASALYELAKVKQADAKFVEALALYKEALELRKESDKKRAVTERSNNIDCAICLAGIGSIELIQKNDSEAFKSFNQAIFYAKEEGIADSDPISQMLWEKSRIAANKMNKVQKPNAIQNFSNDDIVIFPLEEKAKEFREAQDFESSIKTINTVIGIKRAHVDKIVAEEQDQIENSKCQLAASLVFKGELALMMGEKKDAKDCVNEATALYKESGVKQDDERLQRIEKFHQEIRQVAKAGATEYLHLFSGLSRKEQKVRIITKAPHDKTGKTKGLKNIGHTIRRMKRRSESTMGEF